MPAGASLREVNGQTSAVDFVVRSRGAAAMSLLLARAPKQDVGQGKPGGCLEIALDPDVNRTGDLWHICVEVKACPYLMHSQATCRCVKQSMHGCTHNLKAWMLLPQ